MFKRNVIQPEETVQDIPGLSADATAASAEEHTTSLPIRTSIRAGTGIDWQSLFGPLEGDSGNV